MKHWKLTLIIVALAVLIPIGGVFLYSNFSVAQGPEEELVEAEDIKDASPRTVELLDQLQIGESHTGFINIRGKIVSDGNVRLTSGLGATVKEILFTQGQAVKKGDVLLRLGGRGEDKHNVELVYEQALIAQENVEKTVQNTRNSTNVLVRQAEQQAQTLDVNISNLNTTLALTRNAGNYTVQGAEIGLNSLQNTLNRTQSLRDNNANQLDLTGDQAQEMAGIQVNNTAVSLLTTLKGAYVPLVSGLEQLTSDDDFADYEDDLDDIVEDLEDFESLSTNRINDRLGDLTDVVNRILEVNEQVAASTAEVTDAVAKPLASTLTQVSSAMTNAATIAVTQLSVTKNQLESLPNTTGIQLQTLDSQIAGISDQLRSLQNTIEQARNGTELQAQGINAQVQGLKQQKVSANLAVEGARIAAKSQMDGVNGQMELVNKQLEQARNAVAQLEVISPIDGYIVDVPVNVDEEVGLGRELVTVYATNVLFVRATIAPADRDSVQIDEVTDLSISTTTSTGKVGAKVLRIAPVADANGQIPIDLAFIPDDLPASFVPGITVQGQLPKQRLALPTASASLTLPLNAIKLEGGKSYVFVYSNGEAAQKEVVLGPNDNGQVLIVSGVTSTDRIIVSDVSALYDGIAVMPSNE